jgi:hypothetical protein
MRPCKLITFGTGLALIGLQGVQAQVTIDIEKLTCYHFLADKQSHMDTLVLDAARNVYGADK